LNSRLNRSLVKLLAAHVSNKLGVSPELVERDVILHALLRGIYDNEELGEKLVFRGGTCLVKCHLGYYRFSEDLDFVSAESPKHASETRELIRNSITPLLDMLGFEKEEEKWFGTRKRKLWVIKYRDKETGALFKLEVLFGEEQLFDYVSTTARTLLKWQRINLPDIPKPLLEVYSSLNVTAYSLEEILAEKFRALLTRKELHARDIYDMYMITTRKGLELRNIEEGAVRKILSTLQRFGKDRQTNLCDTLKKRSPKDIKAITFEKESYLFLKPPKIPSSFLEELAETSKRISGRIMEYCEHEVYNKDKQGS